MSARALLLALALIGCSRAWLFAQEEVSQAALPVYQTPEDFVAQQRGTEYLPYVKQFLADHPRDPRAPRIALDMLMAASLAKQPADIKTAKLLLLLQYPDTLPGEYFLKTSTASDVATLLKERFNDQTTVLDRETLKRLARIILRGHQVFGGSFCDDDLWAQCALAVQDVRLATAVQKQIKNADGKAAKTVAILVDTKLDLRAKFVAMQPLREYATARAFQRFLFSELTEEERADTDVRIVTVENLLYEQRLATALPLLSELCKSQREPRLLFWYGWTQGASGDAKAAQETFAALKKEHPDDPWSATAAQLSPLLDNMAATLDVHVEALDRAVGKIATTTPEVLELTIVGAGEQDASALYMGLDLARDGFELISTKGQQQQLAYAVGAAHARFFMQGDAAIRQFNARGLCPVFTLKLEPKPAGGFATTFHFNTVAQGSGALKQSVVEILKQPFFATPGERRKFLEHALRSGGLPLPVVTEGEVRRLRWVSPRVDSAELQPFEICLDSEDRVTAIHGDEWHLRDIHYGKRDIKLAAPSWPQLPIEATAEMGATDFMRLFGAVMSLMGTDQKPAADVAQGKTSAPR